MSIEDLSKTIKLVRIEDMLLVSWNFHDKTNWNNPEEVIDRLNSPELVEFWFKHNFVYDWSKFWITDQTAYPQSAEKTIKRKMGICFDAAYLAYTCLKRAGFEATGLNVYFGKRTAVKALMHSVCVIATEESAGSVFYKIADTSRKGFFDGPHKSINEVAERVALMHRVPLGVFTTGILYYNYIYVEASNIH